MAPEILLEKDFDEKVDIYSFGIMIWELYEQTQPYKDTFSSMDELVDAIGLAGERPPISKSTPPTIKKLMQDCWNLEPTKRPSFDTIISQYFPPILVEATILDPLGATFWKQHFLNKVGRKNNFFHKQKTHLVLIFRNKFHGMNFFKLLQPTFIYPNRC